MKRGLIVLIAMMLAVALGTVAASAVSELANGAGSCNAYLPLVAWEVPTPTPTATATPTPTVTPTPWAAIPDDPYYGEQWGLDRVRAPEAWVVAGGGGVAIAVIDTGVDLSHPDLAGKLLPGHDFVNLDDVAQDDNGHGTHVAGIAAAVTNNGLGVAGLGRQAQILPVKVLDSGGKGYTSDVIDGISWAVGHGAKIINLSLGSPDYSTALQSATDYAYAHGVLVVTSAGNCGDLLSYSDNGCSVYNPAMYPAANPNVLAVAATAADDSRAAYSSFGPYVGVAAPGDNIVSTWLWAAGGYQWESGTSMAAPLVSGLASLVWSSNPSLTNAQIESIIEATAVDLGSPGRDDYFGYGRVDAAAAVEAARTGTVASVQAASPSPPNSSNASAIEGPVRSGVVLVHFRASSAEPARRAALQAQGLAIARQIARLDIVAVRVPPGQERQAAARLRGLPEVEFAEPDYLLHATR